MPKLDKLHQKEKIKLRKQIKNSMMKFNILKNLKKISRKDKVILTTQRDYLQRRKLR
jgi:hypothetical protein